MGFEDHKLRVFCTVVETKSFSKASEIIHLTQPAVSLQIQALEEAFETKLFDRSSSTVTLTRAGEILYSYAKQILGLYSSIEKDIGAVTGLVKGSLSIGASTTIGNYLLPAVISEFKQSFPKIKIQLIVGNTKRIVEFLKAGNLNLGLVEGDVSKFNVMTEKLISDELSLIVAPFHPWAKKKEIAIQELTKEPFIIREEGSGTRQIIEKYLAKKGISVQDMKISAVIGSTEAIKEAVENGIGVSIVSKWAIRKESRYGTISKIAIKDLKMLREFSLIFNKKSITNYASDEFLAFLKSYPYEKLLP
jgi:DNA-binding transcriptional LysR family regulator